MFIRVLFVCVYLFVFVLLFILCLWQWKNRKSCKKSLISDNFISVISVHCLDIALWEEVAMFMARPGPDQGQIWAESVSVAVWGLSSNPGSILTGSTPKQTLVSKTEICGNV